MGSGAANVDADGIHLDGFLPPDGSRYFFPLGIRYMSVLVKIVMQQQAAGQATIRLRVQH